MNDPPVCGLWDVGHAEYHADRTRVSHSALEVFRDSVPRYAGIYLDGTIDSPDRPEFAFGRAFHRYLLEPHRWDAETLVVPKVDRRTKEGKRLAEEFHLAARGRDLVSEADFEVIRKMAAAALSNDLAAGALRLPGVAEQGITWVHPDSGVPVKNLIDKFCWAGLILDVKTAQGPCPRQWCRQATAYGYDRQAALYLQGARLALGQDDLDFYFIVVGKEPPHECVVYGPEDALLVEASLENDDDLRELADRRARGNWSSRHAHVVEPLALPAWKLRGAGRWADN